MIEFKEAQYNEDGSIDCLVLIAGSWSPFTVVKGDKGSIFDVEALRVEAEKVAKKYIKNEVVLTAAEKEAVLNQSIEDYIYSIYSQKTQAQDQLWLSSYTAKLKAAGFENLENFVLDAAKKVFDGLSMDEALGVIVDSYQRKMIAKLIKIALRIEWAEQVIDSFLNGSLPPVYKW